jgi:hypothetical protein
MALEDFTYTLCQANAPYRWCIAASAAIAIAPTKTTTGRIIVIFPSSLILFNVIIPVPGTNTSFYPSADNWD